MEVAEEGEEEGDSVIPDASELVEALSCALMTPLDRTLVAALHNGVSDAGPAEEVDLAVAFDDGLDEK